MVIKLAVDRPNIKVNVGKYQTKRVVKGDKSLVLLDTARQISNLLADEYGIVYMDSKKDIEIMVNCLKGSCVLDANAYCGGITNIEKMRVDSLPRNKDFQLLVATQSHEGGTHSLHMQSIIWKNYFVKKKRGFMRKKDSSDFRKIFSLKVKFTS